MVKIIIDYCFVLARGDKGFRQFIKYTLLRVEATITNFESGGISKILANPDNYVIAKRIMSLYNGFIDQLTDEEKAAIKRIRYGKIKQEEYESFYGGVYIQCVLLMLPLIRKR